MTSISSGYFFSTAVTQMLSKASASFKAAIIGSRMCRAM